MQENLKKIFQNRLFMYPSDGHYIRALGQNLGLTPEEDYKLFSIMGGQELSDTLPLASYSNFQCKNKKDTNFRFNLHTHTLHSDGQLQPKQLLEQALEIANRNTHKKDLLPPFTIAITDHNNIDALYEILKELIKDPIRYSNLRVVLGCELGAVWKDEQKQKNPFIFEMLYYGLNPFDKHFKSYLDEHLRIRQHITKLIFEKLKTTFPKARLSENEAFLKDEILKKNVSYGVPGRILSYVKQKILDTNCHQILYDICYFYHHRFETPAKEDPYQDYQDLFNLLRQSGFGFLGVAHPQKMNVGNFLAQNYIDECNQKQLNAGYEMIYLLLNKLKAAGLRALEINYQFDLKEFQNAQKMLLKEIPVVENDGNYQWLKLFKDYAVKYDLLEAGGYDTHSMDVSGR